LTILTQKFLNKELKMEEWNDKTVNRQWRRK
jgi:hypothetical protein